LLKGLVFVPARDRSDEIGARRAVERLIPYLHDEQISIHVVANKNLRLLLRSGASLVKHGVKGADFVLFNATGGLKSPYALILYQLAKLASMPVFIYWREMDLAFNTLSDSEKRRVDFLGTRRSVSHFANSNATSDYIRTRFPGIEISLVSNCAFVNQDISRSVRHPSTDPPYVVSIGRKCCLKGIDLFVTTAIQACQLHPTVEFIWLGAGRLPEELYGKICQAGLQDRILFPGFLEDPAILLRGSSLFFMCSREESFSQATAEAMCLGRHVVTFESGGPPELLGGYGTVLPNFDTGEASKAILEYLKMPPERQINHKLRSRYGDLYSPEQHAKRLSIALREHIR